MRSRTPLIVALLAASFLTTLFIAARALTDAIYHRATAERAIRDFAGLAADEFTRAADAQISFYGCYPLAQQIAAGTMPAPAPPARRVFRVDTRGGANADVPAPLRPRLDAALRNRTSAVRAGGSTYYLGVAGREELPAVIGALELEPRQFAPYLRNVLRMRALVPHSIAEGKLTNEAVFVRVRDGAATIFETAGRFDPQLGVRRELTPTDGVMAGLTLETSINRRVAPLLVLGGLPRSTLPLYGTMLAVNLLLLAMAVLQLQRERALARLRSDFISGVSHELRTPLTQIQMFAQTLLLDRVRGDEERRRSLAIIDQETRRLAHLVENILQFSRGERGTLRITRAPHDLGRLVRETADAFAPIARARGVAVDVDAEESVADVDEEAVRQIVLNLLDNAVKYGPPRQRVLVRVRGREISVDDEGPGIPPREREAVFGRYKRLDRERGRAIAGMGIGLSVVRELVELHGGRVRVEEGGRGGARFVVAL